ncbi:DeoR/GlpR family DNA-binding transcription regulator [Saccharopolyspora rosea]|uniref:DeoR/GlpR family DNA-binding transcription regulator n=1 Tax=Saccharopolyspora rosea TaxID=524884 RepID=A0ABW3FZL7_9PSEU|nr:DeoR/GlpR family DNA-binding transcription regulator [Saccharopolyspora rosea]
MNRHERLSRLLDIVGQRQRADVEELAAELDVSAATIRRDLDHLAEQQLLARTRGGAVATSVAYDLPLRHKAARHAPEKQRISAAAARLVQPGMVIGLNGGTTTTEVARSLATRADLAEHGDPGLTVVTNALNIANELVVRPHIKIVVTGGVARQQSFELTGPLATHILREITLDLLFLGVDAIEPGLGASAHHEGEASINRLMASRAGRVVVVADGSKLGRRAFAQICATETIDTLITDAGAEVEVVRAFEIAGVRVLTA